MGSALKHHPSSMDYSQQKTTGRQLQRLIYYSAVPCRLRSTECAIYDVDCDEVFYGVYIGDAAAAKNKEYLRAMGITHVLNAAEGTKYGQVDTGHIYYRDMPKLRYMGFQVIDQITSDISRYFYLAAKFIENALNSGGKVLVHCLVGMSRSATCVIAYLMICRKMSAAEAIRKIRMRRSIRPNDGFLQQLADLDNELRADRERHHY
ncbi:DUSP3 family protein [Megaselia abdita]